MGRLVHLEESDTIEHDLPSSIPAMMMRPAQSAEKEQPKRALPPENPFAVAVTQAYLLLEQRLELRAAGGAVTREQIRDAEIGLEQAEAEAEAELRRVLRREKMDGAARRKVAETRERELRGKGRDAEEEVRFHCAPALEMRYRGLIVTAWPDRAMSQTDRMTTMSEFSQCIQACRVDMTRELNHAVAGAKGSVGTEPRYSTTRLEGVLKDVARRSIKRNLITVTRA
jgi:hypothetical protein